MKKAIISILLAVITLPAFIFAGTPGKPAPKRLTTVKPFVKPATVVHTGLKAYLCDDAVILLPVPQVTVQTNVLGAPGSTGTAPCTGTFVTVSQVNECGQTEIIQQYWVQSSIHCQNIVN